MATKTAPPGDAKQLFNDHVHHNVEELKAYINNLPGFGADKIDRKEVRELLEKLERKYIKDAKSLTTQEADILAAKMQREIELTLQKLAKGEGESEDKEHEETSAEGQVKKETKKGNVPDPATVEKGEMRVQTAGVAEPKSSIVRGGFGKTAATAAAGETVKLAGQAPSQPVTEQQRLDSRIQGLKNQAAKAQKAPRGGSIWKFWRREKSPDIAAEKAREKRLKKIQKELKKGNTPAVIAAAQSEVHQSTMGIAGNPTLSVDERLEAMKGKARLANAQAQSHVDLKPIVVPGTIAAMAAAQDIHNAGIAQKGVEKLEGLKRTMPATLPGTQDVGVEISGEYGDRGAGTADRRDEARGNPNRERDDGGQSREQAQPTVSNSPKGGAKGGGKLRKFANKKLKQAPEQALNKTAKVATKILLETAKAFFNTPQGRAVLIGLLIIFLIIILVLFILFILFNDDAQYQQAQQQAACNVTETLNVVQTGPATAINGPLQYTMTITDSQPMQDLTIVETLPTGVNWDPKTISSPDWPKMTVTGNTITWKASDNLPPGKLATAPINISFKFTLQTTVPDAHLIYVINSTPIRNGGAGAGGKPVIVLDPGHSGTNISTTDSATGLLDHDYPNIPEIDEVWQVAQNVKTKLEADGYTVILTKNAARDSVGHRARATVANNANAALAISIHNDHGQSWTRFAQVYVQRVGFHRDTAAGKQIAFTLDPVAQKSQAYGATIASERTAAEGHPVTVTVSNFNGRTGLAPGNIPLVQLFATVPWVYNEVGAAPAGQAMTPDEINRYSQGIINGVEKSVPVTAGAGGGTGGGTGGCGGSTGPGGGPPNVNAGDFETLVKGQGRNTQILGDENTFVKDVLKNDPKDLTGKDAMLRQIYEQALAKNVDPLIVLTIWGVEQGFNDNGKDFGCGQFHAGGADFGFANQLACSVRVLDTHLKEFEQANKVPFPHPLAPQCTYTDAFVYAYERYTPVCAINDSNAGARNAFVIHFKQLYGTGP